MAIRIRKVGGVTVALCAVESDKKAGDTYLDDTQHAALATKFALDWNGSRIGKDLPFDSERARAMESEKVRDAKEEIEKWLAGRPEQKTEPTFWARVYIAGPLEIIKHGLREECMRAGLCVTIDPTAFIYTGGEEAGAVVQLINYPRFPSTQQAIFERAESIAYNLLDRACQNSALLMTPEKTVWISRQIEGERHK